METNYENIITMQGQEAISFDITTKKGRAIGLFFNNRIWVHLIDGDSCVKGLMQILINKFNCKHITFTPLINDNVKNVVRGVIKICPADSPDNPYKENFEYLECEWEK